MTNTSIEIKTKGSILKTISDAIYSTPVDKIREITANSFDAKASCIVMTISDDQLSFLDNGHGMDINDVKEIFKSLGFGLKRGRSAMSHFGLGLISILQLSTTKAFFYSKKNNIELLIEIDTKEMFNVDNHKQELSTFSKYLKNIESVEDIKAIVYKYSKKLRVLNTREVEKHQWTSFTELILTKVQPEIINDVMSAEVERKLGVILPLQINENDALINKIDDISLKKQFIEFFNDKEKCPSIEFYINNETSLPEKTDNNVAEEDTVKETNTNKLKQVYKYFYDFSNVLKIKTDNLKLVKGSNYIAYILTQVNDLYEKDSENAKVYGFSIRNNNFLIKEGEFFDYPFIKKEKINTISKPLRNWIYGEIYCTDAHEMLKVSRNEFKENDGKFQTFVKEFSSNFLPYNAILRKAYNGRKNINDGFVEPIERLINSKPFDRIESIISTRSVNEREKAKLYNSIYANLKQNAKKRKWFGDDEYCIDNIVNNKNDFKLIVSDIQLSFTNELLPNQNEFEISFDEKKLPILRLPKSLFNHYTVDFLGRKFAVKFVYLGEDGRDEDVLHYNMTDALNEIYINLFSDKIRKYTIDVIEVLLAIDVAYNVTNTKEQMKEYLISYFQQKSDVNLQLFDRLEQLLSMRART